jgi:hypothetical protein
MVVGEHVYDKSSPIVKVGRDPVLTAGLILDEIEPVASNCWSEEKSKVKSPD